MVCPKKSPRAKQLQTIVGTILLILSLSACCSTNRFSVTEPSIQQEETHVTTPTTSPMVPAAPADRNPESVSGASFGTIAETGDGYYALMDNLLYYADKSDPTSWVVVCNRPDCKHEAGYGTCSADLFFSSGFLLWNGRIYTLQHPEASSSKGKFAICSMALDGTDFNEERLIEEIPQEHDGGYLLRWTSEGIYFKYSVLNIDGTFNNGIKRITGAGVDTLYTGNSEEIETSNFSCPLSGTGDYAAYTPLLSEEASESKHLYRFTKDGFEEIPGITNYNLLGGLLKGNSLYRFTSGDGYYYTDLATGKSLKWMDSQFPDSYAEIFGTDLVMETNMHFRASPEIPEMRIFDGMSWKSVSLPEDIWSGENPSFTQASVLTSQHLFFFVRSYDEVGRNIKLYSVDLTADTYEAVLCHSSGA